MLPEKGISFSNLHKDAHRDSLLCELYMLSSTNALDFLAAHEMPGDSMIPVAPGGSEIAEITSPMTFLRLTF